ncbi:MAG: ROK family protein [Clostridia bacterium]
MNYLLADLGGTNLAIGLCDAEGNPIGKALSIPTQAHLPKEALLEHLCGHLSSVAKNSAAPVCALLMGIPTKEENGVLAVCDNLPTLVGTPFRAELTARLGLPVHLTGDALCYAMGAYKRLGCEGNALTVTLGTGVGVAWILNGKPFLGNGFTGEVWRAPYAGVQLEDVISTRGLLEELQTPSVKEGAALAASGDSHALAAFEHYGHALGTLLCYGVGLMDPHCIVLGGGIAKAFPLFENEVRTLLRKHSMRGEVPIKICSDPDGWTPLLGAYWIMATDA